MTKTAAATKAPARAPGLADRIAELRTSWTAINADIRKALEAAAAAFDFPARLMARWRAGASRQFGNDIETCGRAVGRGADPALVAAAVHALEAALPRLATLPARTPLLNRRLAGLEQLREHASGEGVRHDRAAIRAELAELRTTWTSIRDDAVVGLDPTHRRSSTLLKNLNVLQHEIEVVEHAFATRGVPLSRIEVAIEIVRDGLNRVRDLRRGDALFSADHAFFSVLKVDGFLNPQRSAGEA